MLWKALLLTMIAVVAVGMLVGSFLSVDGVLGGVGGIAIGLTIDLVLGLALGIVLAVVRVASGTGVRHRRIG